MRILYLAPTPYYSVRGAPLVTHQTLQRMSARGDEVDLLTFPMGEDRELPHVTITRCGRMLALRRVGYGVTWRKGLLDTALFLRFCARVVACRLKLRRGYDCVFALDEMAFGCWLVKWLLPCPIIYDMDSSMVELFNDHPRLSRFRRVAEFFERRFVAAADVVLCQCSSYAERIAHIDAQKLCVIAPDVPLITAEEVDRAPTPPQLAHIDLGRPLILYVGNFASHQGVDQLFDGYRLVQQEGLEATLAVAGGDPAKVAHYTATYPDILFLGTVPPEDLPGLYRAARVVISPRAGGTNTPMKIYDYMHSGAVIVATDRHTHTQVLDDTCAILVEPTAEGLAGGMIAALSDPEPAAALAKRARQRVLDIAGRELFNERLETALKLVTRS